MKKRILGVILLASLLLVSCAGTQQTPAPQKNSDGYYQIGQDEAARMMEKEKDAVILDVRTVSEYDSGHIPGAVAIPNEIVSEVAPDELPDLDQVILVYCRSGRRSKEASAKLAALGYTNVYEFGGVQTWTGELVTTEIP